MKTHSEFDYDLWTTNYNGIIKYWSRVKSTGEVTEINEEIMRFLNSEDKRLRRHLMQASDAEVSVLSLDMPLESGLSLLDTLEDSTDIEDMVTNHMMITKIKEQLTPGQLKYFIKVFEQGQKLSEYAAEQGIAVSTAHGISEKVKKKFKNFFEGAKK